MTTPTNDEPLVTPLPASVPGPVLDPVVVEDAAPEPATTFPR